MKNGPILIGEFYYYTNTDGEDIEVEVIFVDTKSILVEETLFVRKNLTFNQFHECFRKVDNDD